MARTLLALALVGMLFAGCAGSTDGTDDPGAAAQSASVSVSDTTGAIRGIVLDIGIHPIQGAKVSVVSEGKTLLNTTNVDGVFTFSNLPPGTYFIHAEKVGFKNTQQSAEVKAGDANPPITKIQLEADAAAQKPSHDSYHFKGFIECSFLTWNFFWPCYNPLTGDPVLQENSFTKFPLSGGNVSQVHVSLSWKPTQDFGKQLYFNLCYNTEDYPNSCEVYTFGDAPYIYGDAKAKVAKKFEDSQTIYFETSTWGIGDQGVLPRSPGGFSFEQPFDAYFVVFHNWKPADGYVFAKDGEPKDPK